MTVKLGVVMDPISEIKVKKDTTLAFLLAAQRRGWLLYYLEQQDIFAIDGVVYARMSALTVADDEQKWYEIIAENEQPLDSLDVVLMRKDPPFDMEYIYTTYLLQLAQLAGVLVVNNPSALRDVNEKFYTSWFPQCCPPTLVTRSARKILDFLHQQEQIIIKPLAGMGGQSIFRVDAADPNIAVIIETLTHNETCFVMVQRYLPAINEQGDKRVFLINGEPVLYALARYPAKGEIRANLAAGGHGVGVEISDRDRWICGQVGPVLKQKGLLFVGLDIIGDYLTEINVTSPTCVRELEAQFNIDISSQFLDVVEEALTSFLGP